MGGEGGLRGAEGGAGRRAGALKINVRTFISR